MQLERPPLPTRRSEIPTPALIVDRPALDHNIGLMADVATRHGVGLRPHAKTHKCGEIGRLQMAAGAIGLCCATLDEAEALAATGLGRLLITSPIVTQSAIERLCHLNREAEDLQVVVDHPDNVDRIGAAAAQAGCPLKVLVDIDVGQHRTGVAHPADAIALARGITSRAALRYAGLQFYCGAEQHIADFAERRGRVADRIALLEEHIAALSAEGYAPEIITGGGTGSHLIDCEIGPFTDLQPGSYIFMDRDYLACDLNGRGGSDFHLALTVDATVVSANQIGLATLDAGTKAFSSDAGPPGVLTGVAPGAEYRFMGDEHGMIVAPGTAFQIGARIALTTPHCDPTVNLYDHYYLMDGDRVEGIWTIDARGRGKRGTV